MCGTCGTRTTPNPNQRPRVSSVGKTQSFGFCQVDMYGMVILVMLDLSSAFDTIEHEVLLTRLEHTFGITDKALAWLRSYLSKRHQNVVVDSTMSADYVLQCGVPQGSVFGPVLYCMYTRPVCDIFAMACSTTAMQTIYKSMQPSEEISVLRPHC